MPADWSIARPVPRPLVAALMACALALSACRPPSAPPEPFSAAEPSPAPPAAEAAPVPEIPEADLALVEVPPAPRSLQPVEEFEGRDVPAGLEADAGGALRITTARSKSGVRALAWRWTKPDASLWIRRPAELALWNTLKGGDRNSATLAFWCHRAEPGGGTLRLEFHGATGVLARCWFHTDFRGWRALGAPWADVLGGCRDNVTAVRVIAPAGEASGELCLDRLGLFCGERPQADYQQPWIGAPDGLAREAPLRFSAADYAVGRPWLPARAAVVPISLLRDASNVQLRLAGPLVAAPPANKLLPTNRLAQLEAALAKYRLRELDGIVAGEPIQNGGFHQPPGGIHVSTAYGDLGALGRAFRETGDPAQRAQIRGWTLALGRLLLDHGWVPGNRNAGSTEGGYAERDWPGGLFVCREALADTPEWADLLRQVIWFFGGPNAAAERPWGDTDIHLNGTPSFIQAIARLPVGPEQVQLLLIAQRYLNLTYVQDTLLPPDGTVRHHDMFHLAYGSYSMPSLVSMAQWFEGTGFAISEAALDRLKEYVRTAAWVSNLHSVPANANGRAGNPLGVDVSGLALSLARQRGPLDREQAALFLAKNTNPRHPAVAELAGLGLTAAPLEGHRTLNYAAGALHRRGRWLAALFGMPKAGRGLEIYGWMDGNNYGRYARHGSLLIQGSGEPRDARASGFREAGWNWCFWPGATSLVRPSHELYDYYALYGLGGTALSGGTTLGRNGVWAMDVPGRDVTFRKSAFFFDHRIVLVTTDIASKSGRPAVTTLFQNSLETTNAPTGINGKGSAKPFQLAVPAAGAPSWLFDTQRTGYVLPAGHPRVQVSRGAQSWTCMFDRHLKDPKDNPLTKQGTSVRFRHPDRAQNEAYYLPTTGSFERAWLEHGTDPTNGSCWYTVLVDTTPAAVQAFAASLADPARAPVRVLQANRTAHVVVDTAARSVGYAIFDPAGPLPSAGPLVSASQPCVALMQVNTSSAELSLAQPDPARTQPVSLHLRGAWRVDGTLARVQARPEQGSTVLTVDPDGIMPLVFTLQRTSSSPSSPNAEP
jgi:chondroitin-sulfate-ABC endolyase/exolyase